LIMINKYRKSENTGKKNENNKKELNKWPSQRESRSCKMISILNYLAKISCPSPENKGSLVMKRVVDGIKGIITKQDVIRRFSTMNTAVDF